MKNLIQKRTNQQHKLKKILRRTKKKKRKSQKIVDLQIQKIFSLKALFNIQRPKKENVKIIIKV
jgi:hypothetical protein